MNNPDMATAAQAMRSPPPCPVGHLSDWLPLPERQYDSRFASQYRLLVLSEDDSRVRIACADPELLPALVDCLFEAHEGRQLEFLRVDAAQLQENLARLNADLYGPVVGVPAHNSGLPEDRLDQLAEDAPAVNLVNSLFLEALRLDASDIHLESHNALMVVRFRTDGLLRAAFSINRRQALAVTARIKLLAGLNILESRLPQDGRMDIATGNQRFDVRVSVLPSNGGESLVLRLFRERQTAFELEDLGLSAAALQQLSQLSASRDGLILATGPTGCGKTTTIHALLRRIDRVSNKIVTLEDPVESSLPGAVQIQVRDELGLSFEELLKRLFRHDPDVIMLGEIRDPRSAELALRAGLTGHLVYSTLHTNDALASVTRMHNLGIEAWLLGSVLRAVVAQRLVRRLCPVCRQAVGAGAREQALFGKAGLPVPQTVYRAVGCPECSGSGYRGRLAVMEVLRIDEHLAALIGRDRPLAELRHELTGRGFCDLWSDALSAVAAGLSSMEEVEREVSPL